MGAVRFTVEAVEFFERDVRLRMPFRFGVVTLTEAPQAFVVARIRLENGVESEGAAAEMLVPKWFDKDPALSNAQNFDQLRDSLRSARDAYLGGGTGTAWGHFLAHYRPGLVAGFGPAQLDRALLDALCRALGVSFYDALRRNAIGATDVDGMALPEFLAGLRAGARIAARHTVGLVDPVSAADLGEPVCDGLPETLEDVVARYGHRYYKLKVGGDLVADIERLAAIAAVLDRLPDAYRVSLDGNEQYEDMEGVACTSTTMAATTSASTTASQGP